jgi:PhnB protein
MTFTPYIHFQGNCAEAMQFYADLFGGELTLFRYSEMPDAPPNYAKSDLVMNCHLRTETASFYASDFPPDEAGEPQQAFSISHDAPDATQAKAIYDRLMEGGTAIMPFGPTFWSPAFGMLKDRFGTHWMISVPYPA